MAAVSSRRSRFCIQLLSIRSDLSRFLQWRPSIKVNPRPGGVTNHGAMNRWRISIRSRRGFSNISSWWVSPPKLRSETPDLVIFLVNLVHFGLEDSSSVVILRFRPNENLAILFAPGESVCGSACSPIRNRNRVPAIFSVSLVEMRVFELWFLGFSPWKP